MRKKRITVIISVILAALLLAIGVYAYYEYYGKYSALIQVNGVIRLNAFAALDEEYREPQYGYGVTPENPFVIDNQDRMNNLIVLNNGGKLLSAKEAYGADKFYFAFNFTEQPTPQVLSLSGITQEPVGNNDYPFIDNLTGLLYAYLVSDSEYVYLSAGGSADVVDEGGTTTINGQSVTIVSGTATTAEYIKVPDFYITLYPAIADNPYLIRTSDDDYYLPVTSLLAAPQIVSDVTVKAPEDQIDVGFISCIGREYEMVDDGQGGQTVNLESIVSRSSVSDIILYNITIDCTESQPNAIKTALDAIWESILSAVPGHIFADTEAQTDRRHIGLFAGHIDGMAHNITVAGEGVIKIDGADINTYSRFTTVGYIDDRAIINNIPFSELTISGTGAALLSQPFFADSIYELAQKQPNVYEYPLKNINGQLGIWSGITTTSQGGQNINHFSQGIFKFILSHENDTVRDIWQGRGNINLLNAEGFNVTQSVLYCANEYRYSESQQGGGSLVSTGASANETRYAGVSTLTASGNILDRGQYIIVAKIYDEAVSDYKYYALKIIAEIGQDGTIVYNFDDSEKVDVTTYINGGAEDGIYSSCIWYNNTDTQDPTFNNTRFRSQYLSVSQDGSSLDLTLTNDPEGAATFRASVADSTFSYSIIEAVGSGYVTTRYYLNFNTDTSSFYFSTENNTVIEIYQISYGFNLELVDDIADLTLNDDYIITAQYGGNHYLLGVGTSEGVGGAQVVDGTFATDLSLQPMPTNWNIGNYHALKRYVWNASYASSGVVAFHEKLSSTYYLGYSGSSLALTQQQINWTYTQGAANGGTLRTAGSYLTYINGIGNCSFTLGVNEYTIYIYKLVPDDKEPLYHTYRGARLLSAESSVVQKGQYMIAANTGSSYQALVMTNTNTLGVADVTVYANGTATKAQLDLLLDNGTNEGYKWEVGTTSPKPSLQNIKYASDGSYLSNSANTQPALSTIPVQWMYDAVSGRLYYRSSDTLYYMAYNNSTTTFVITSDPEAAGLIYEIRLYKVIYEYEYAGVAPVQDMSYNDATYSSYHTSNTGPVYQTYIGPNKYYFLLTAPLTSMATNPPYALGSYSYDDQGTVESINIAPTSTYDAGNSILTTTCDLSYYRWVLDVRTTGQTSTTVYDCGYQLVNDATHMFLGASNDPNSRTLVVLEQSNINVDRMSGNANFVPFDGGSPTGIGLGASSVSLDQGPFYRTDANGNYIGNSFCIMGRRSPYEYYVWKTPSPGVFALALNTNNTNPRSPKPAEYTYPYLYEATGYDINVLIEEVNEIGDNLDVDMNYMITARVDNPDSPTSFYALGETIDELNNKVICGTNVTSQAAAINNSNILDENNNIIEQHSTDMLIMVPVEVDWHQTSSDKGLYFYQDYYSTNVVRDWLTASGSDIGITSINVNISTHPETQWYYDGISKYMFYISGGIKYYLTYDITTNTFSLTTDMLAATHTYIYRFKPTYVVSRVTDAANDSLKSGDFIIAGRDAEGYTSLGIADDGLNLEARNVAEYIKETLTETERNEILNHIWKQHYYDFYTATYDPESTTQYMQLFSYITGGGFTIIHDTSTGGMDLSSDPMVWRITNNNGLWDFINNRANGTVSANTRAIRFTGDTSNLTIRDSYTGPDRYIASGISCSFAATGYPIVLCDTSGNPVTSPVNGTSYLLLARDNGVNLSAVKNSSGTISLVNYTSDTGQDAGCLWTATENVGGWVLANAGRYISANSSGVITSATTANGTWSVSASGQLSYATYNFPYRQYTSGWFGGESLRMTTDTGSYSARLYDYNSSTGTLTPTTSTGSNKVLLVKTGTTYYAVGMSYSNWWGTSFSFTELSGVSVQPNGTITTTTGLSNTYTFSSATSGSGITLRNSSTNRYLTYSGTSFGSDSSSGTTFYLDSNKYFYYSKGTVYTPYATQVFNTSPSDGITVYMYEHNSGVYTLAENGLQNGKTYVMVLYDQSEYYLIGHDSFMLTRTSLGTTLPVDWTSNITSSVHHIFAIDGPIGKYLYFSGGSSNNYLTVSNNYFMLTGTQTTQWEYNYSGILGSDSRLYSIISTNLAAAHLMVGETNNIETTSTVMPVTLYQATDNGDETYTLTSKTSSGMPASGTYVITIYQDGICYAVRYTSNGIIGYNLGSTVLEGSVIPDIVWTADGTSFKKTVGSQTYYIRRNQQGLYLGTSQGATWTYTYNNVAASFTATDTTSTPLYIFRVDKSAELDDVTDTISMLSGKAKLTQSVSLFESGNYMIVAEVDENGDSVVDRYYSLSMNDIYNSRAIDVTALMNLSLGFSSSYVTFFDSSVWINQGTDLEVILKNRGYTDTYLLTGAQGNLEDMTPQIELVDDQSSVDLTEYKWRVYTHTLGLNSVYLLGYVDTSTGIDTIYYMYFDSDNLQFKLTTDVSTAASMSGRVQLYQVASMTPVQPAFHSYVIEVAEDGQTILSFPIKLVESQADIYKYTETQSEGQTLRTGEYLIAAVVGHQYYTMTLSELLNLSYVDVNPYFSGNFSIDVDGNYCISVNSEYIWKQISEPSIALNFENTKFEGYYLSSQTADFIYDIENRQLYNGSHYLSFDLNNGFTLSSTASTVPINLYLLGQVGVEVGLPGGELQYNYYTQPLTTIGGAVDFTHFDFKKTHMPDLKRYGINYDGEIGSVPGWTLYDGVEILSVAEDSVFFCDGIDTTTDVTEMKNEFIPMTHSTEYDGNPVSIPYYAPAGTASFVIDQASESNPVFVNVIATTELDNILCDPEYLRYLCLWKTASIDLETQQATPVKTYGDGLDEASNYAHTFITNRNTPYAAIPLPNIYGSEASGASYARVDEFDYTLSDAAYGENYFIAHTFVITQPGVYYLGPTYGSVAFTYLAVDNRALNEEGETSGVGFNDQFTIDFCYGDIETSVSGLVPNEAIGDLVYVGHDSWFQSNIHPQWIRGTADNPTDYLYVNVNRTKSDVDDTSSVNFTAYTTAPIAPGILHVNNNSSLQRLTRKADFQVYCNGLDAAAFTGSDDRLWVCNLDGEYKLFSATVNHESEIYKYYLAVSESAVADVLPADKPVLSTTVKYNWNVTDGYLMTPEGMYLVKPSGGYGLSSTSANAVGVYTYDGNLNLITEPVNGIPYLLIANDGANKCVTVNMTQ